MSNKLLKLSFVLQNIQDFPWNHDLYIQNEYPWNSDSVCAILNSEDDDREPNKIDLEYAAQNNLKYALSVQTVQDIVDNAKQQKKDVSEAELIEAFNFYYRNDAFIEFK